MLLSPRLLELTRPRERRLKWLRRGYATDVGYAILTPVVTWTLSSVAVAIVIVPLALVVWGRLDAGLVERGFGPLSRLPLWVQGALLLVGSDFVSYWMHRAFHLRRLWPIHAVHHSSVDLDWLSAARIHPLNEMLMRVAAAFPLLASGLSPVALSGVAPVIALFSLVVHANVDWDWGPLRCVLASPRFHRWHHTSEQEGLNTNFAGILPLWDILFATYYMPEGKVPRAFGTTTPVPTGFLGQLIYPFRGARRSDALASASLGGLDETAPAVPTGRASRFELGQPSA